MFVCSDIYTTKLIHTIAIIVIIKYEQDEAKSSIRYILYIILHHSE
jgi:hypothetical protein